MHPARLQHNAFMAVGQSALVEKRTEVASFICVQAFDWKMDRVKVKEELVPLIFPAVTWGRTEEEKKKQGRGWCIMQKVLWSLWATTTLRKPPPPCCSSPPISISDNVQCMCVPFFPARRRLISVKKTLGKKKKKRARTQEGIWTPGSMIACHCRKRGRNAAEEIEISRTTAAACHLNISSACMHAKKLGHIHSHFNSTWGTLSLHQQKKQKNISHKRWTHARGSMLEHTSTGVPGAGAINIEVKGKREEVLQGEEACYGSSASN